MPELKDVCTIKRRGKGKKRKSNLFTKALAKLQAIEDIKKEQESKPKSN